MPGDDPQDQTTSATATARARRKVREALDRPLTPEEKRFVIEYVSSMDERKAAIAGGWKATRGRGIFRDPRVYAEIQRMLRPRLARRGITREMVMERLGDIAMGDLRLMFDPVTGKLRNPAELDAREAACLAGVKVGQKKTHYGVGGEGSVARIDEQVVEVKRLDPTPALAILAKHFGIVGDGAERQDPSQASELPPLDPGVIATLDDGQLAMLSAAYQSLAPQGQLPPGVPSQSPPPAGQGAPGDENATGAAVSGPADPA